ncbi:MAG: M56 family metallopeptidase [Bacteroidales bacterium]|nr:M56 family metallopeptidase [Bacteroidales bacterium]
MNVFTIGFFTTYILPPAVALAVLYLFYKAIVRNDTHLKTRRFTILGFLVFAMVLPFLNFYFPTNAGVFTGLGGFNAPMQLPVFTVFAEGNIAETKNMGVPILKILGWIYLAIVLLLIGRIFVGILRLRIISKNGRSSLAMTEKQTIVISPNIPTAFSFFNTIFIPETWENSDEKDMVLTHERVHVNQKHSWDLMLMEVICAVQFFNPFVWLLKREMRLNHEYLADKGALENNENPEHYFQFLLQEIVGRQPILAHSLHYSPIKHRIMMQISKPAKLLNQVRYLAFIPVVLALTFLFACQEKSENVLEEILASQNVETSDLGNPIIIVDGVVFDGSVDALTVSVDEIRSVHVYSSSTLDAELINRFGLHNLNTEDGVIIIRTSDDEPEVFQIVENAPSFPGGEEARMRFLQENIRFPQEARDQGIQGVVFVTFVVEKDGRTSNVRILRGIGGGADEEVIRIMEMMPNWTPGKMDGNPVRVQFNMPIRFTLADEAE